MSSVRRGGAEESIVLTSVKHNRYPLESIKYNTRPIRLYITTTDMLYTTTVWNTSVILTECAIMRYGYFEVLNALNRTLGMYRNTCVHCVYTTYLKVDFGCKLCMSSIFWQNFQKVNSCKSLVFCHCLRVPIEQSISITRKHLLLYVKRIELVK